MITKIESKLRGLNASNRIIAEVLMAAFMAKKVDGITIVKTVSEDTNGNGKTIYRIEVET